MKKSIIFLLLLMLLLVKPTELNAATSDGRDIYATYDSQGRDTKWASIAGYQFITYPWKSTIKCRKGKTGKAYTIKCVNAFYYSGNVYYQYNRKINCFNLKSHKKTTLYTTKYDISMIGVIGDKIYYTNSNYSKVYILSIKNKKVKLISDIRKKVAGADIAAEAQNYIYITKRHGSSEGGGVENPEDWVDLFRKDLYVLNPTTKQIRLISKNVLGASAVGDKIYYVKETNYADGTMTCVLYRANKGGYKATKLKTFTFEKYHGGNVKINHHSVYFDFETTRLKYNYNTKKSVSFKEDTFSSVFCRSSCIWIFY